MKPELAPDFELESERLSIRGYGRSQGELCGGTVRWLDDYVDALAPYYDLEPGQIGIYHWFSDDLWEEHSPCPTVKGCVLPTEGAAYTKDVPFEHEIVHLVNGRCIWALDEGLAEYLRGTVLTPSGNVEQVDIEHTLGVDFDGVEYVWSDYHRARNFVSFLVHEYGLESVVELCEASPAGIEREDFDVATREVLGVGLEDLLVAYADYPECDEEQDRAKLLECSREPTFELGLGDEIDVDVNLSCVHPDAVGPKRDLFHVSYGVRILESGEYGVRMRHAGADLTGASLRFEQCASCGDGAHGHSYTWDPNYVALPTWYEAGSYVLELQLPIGFNGDVGIQMFSY
ncbi:MAG: hypothetical protein HC927_00090 [Deltaproteobacteria bacterium]|nr:hypothetical protein [Deltaproteobacteria bacterium]